jgi:CO dehydrogenase maturation factor
MGALSREFLKKLQVDDGQVVLVDMEAGIEHFGRGVETGVDGVLAVVEPSLESVTLAERIRQLALGSKVAFAGVILNKIGSERLKSRLYEALEGRDIPVLGEVPHRQEFALSALEGTAIKMSPVAADVRSIVDSISSVLQDTEAS